jgi:hypothetical protein
MPYITGSTAGCGHEAASNIERFTEADSRAASGASSTARGNPAVTPACHLWFANIRSRMVKKLVESIMPSNGVQR